MLLGNFIHLHAFAYFHDTNSPVNFSLGLFSFDAVSLSSVAQMYSTVACGLTHPFYVSFL